MRRSELNIENLLVLIVAVLVARGRLTYGPTTKFIMIPPNQLVDWFNHNQYEQLVRRFRRIGAVSWVTLPVNFGSFTNVVAVGRHQQTENPRPSGAGRGF